MTRLIGVIGAWLVALGFVTAGCISPSSTFEPTVEPRAGKATMIRGGFERWFDETRPTSGELAAAVEPQLGGRVSWQLNSMGYEVNGGYDPGKAPSPDNWERRMRLFAGTLDPGSDLGQVWKSRYPLILAVLPDQGSGYELGGRHARLMVEGTLWGVSGGELFLKDYAITPARAGASDGSGEAGWSDRGADPVADAKLEQARRVLDVQMVEQLMRNPQLGGRGELVIITPDRPGETSDGHRFSWIELFSDQLFPGVKIAGPQPSKVSPRNVAWDGALWFDNGHCWHGVELLTSAAGPYASLKWINLGPGAESRDCGMRLFR